MSTWTTRAHEVVRAGDLVALSVLHHADAVGRIVAETGPDRITCELVRGRNVRAGDLVSVDPDQMLVKVHE